MPGTKRKRGFFLCLIFNMLISIWGLIPAFVLLILHFWLKISLWWAAGLFAAWILFVVLWTVIVYVVNRYCVVEDKPRKNKNPYSAGNGKNK